MFDRPSAYKLEGIVTFLVPANGLRGSHCEVAVFEGWVYREIF